MTTSNSPQISPNVQKLTALLLAPSGEPYRRVREALPLEVIDRLDAEMENLGAANVGRVCSIAETLRQRVRQVSGLLEVPPSMKEAVQSLEMLAEKLNEFSAASEGDRDYLIVGVKTVWNKLADSMEANWPAEKLSFC